MRKIALIVMMAMLSVGLHAGYENTMETHHNDDDIVKIVKKNFSVTLKSSLEQDWIGYDKIFTLRSDNDDQMSGFRTRGNFDIEATFGEDKYEKSAIDTKFRLASYNFWRREGYYTPFQYETNSPLQLYENLFDVTETPFRHTNYINRDVRPTNILVYVEEAWIDLHFGTIFEKTFDNWHSLEKHPLSLKIGYFPYRIGRGITYGDFPINIPYLGWDAYKYDETRYAPPGILIHGSINKNIGYELYYSKQSENSLYTHMTWDEIHFNKTDGRRKWRGIRKERDLFAAQVELSTDKDWGTLQVKPYAMYIDSPELKVEVLGDASARLGTVGMMAEYTKGRFSINAEVAGQFGHQNMHAIDRNEIFFLRDNPDGDADIEPEFTHVFNNSAYDETDRRDAEDSELIYINHVYNRGGYDSTTKQWIKATTKNGDELQNSSHVGLDAYNSNVTGNARFRDAYRVDYRGFMAVVDMMYEFEEVPVKIAAAGAYISGDKYPFNTECDKRYKAFIPYGDYYYTGKYVHSQIVLEERKLPRPVDISYHHQYAHNNVQDMSNLAYIGLGTKWTPFKDEKDKLLINANVLWFWETTTLKKWSKTQPLPGTYVGTNTPSWERGDQFLGDVSWALGRDFHGSTFNGTAMSSDNGIWCRYTRTDITNLTPCGDLKYVGWKTCDDASRELGLEINFEALYRPVEHCLIKAQLACFIPGQLYEDLAGQPNINTIKGPKADIGCYGLGDDVVWRAVLSVNVGF